MSFRSQHDSLLKNEAILRLAGTFDMLFCSYRWANSNAMEI